MKPNRKCLAAISLALCLFRASAATHYVSLSSPNPQSPYTDWTTAATNIQDAVDAASSGDTVLVTNGFYATGGRSWFGQGTNRVTLTNSITLQSVNGPSVTFIVGTQVAGTGMALINAARCVGIGNNAVLSGFTLTNGSAGYGNYPDGGGVANLISIAASSTVTNCVLINNIATNSVGGGAYRVNLFNCQLIGNSAEYGGGVCACSLLNCLVTSNTAIHGGGVYNSTPFGTGNLTNCTIAGNLASDNGGGVYGGTLVACTISNNASGVGFTFTGGSGGGIYGSTLINCLVVGNSAANGGGMFGGATTNCTIVNNTATGQGGGINGGGGVYSYNSIIYDNTAPSGSNTFSVKFFNCCSAPSVFGGGITNDPLFVNSGSDFHLQANSPCINSGNNAYVASTTDLDGNPRIVGGPVDIGAYEYQTPQSVISYNYLEQYGLPTDGSVDFSDLDGTAFNVYQDWIAGLNPTNPASVLAMLPPAPISNASGITVTWQSVSGIEYNLQRSTNLMSPFITIQTNIFGLAGTRSVTDTTATNNTPYYYRVNVQ